MAAKKRTKKKPRKPRTLTARRGKKAPSPKGGRPRIEFDLPKVGQVLSRGNTLQDLADFLDVSLSTVEKRIHDDSEFASVVRIARFEMKDNLRKAQYDSALAGNGTMLVWLGKNMLGQRDYQKLEVSGAGGGPVHIVRDRRPLLEKKLIDYIRSRRRAAETP